MTVHISPGNHKMGSIPSVSLPAGETCRPDAPCFGKCYARRLEAFRTSVHDSYVDNLAILKTDPETYWREVEGTIMMNRYFRFHVAGDIPDEDYLEHMVDIARRNRHCEILCFTKRYDLVNDLVRKKNTPPSEVIPGNLHLIFSAWRGLEMQNPYGFPEAHVRYKDGTTTARKDAVPCGGNCTECAKNEGGCWNLTWNRQLVIKEH